MSKLLKSKILLGVLIVAVMFVGFAVVKSTYAADCTITSTLLKYGMRSADVTCLQQKLGMTTVTGYFGTMTKAAVINFQTANPPLVADGIVGALTLASLGTGTPPVVSGTLCPNGMTLASNCSTAPSGTTTTTGLSGGAGDATLTDTSTDVEETVKEGEEDVKVLGFKAEADGSDLAFTSLKVMLTNEGYADLDGGGADTTSSEKLTNYIDEVAVYMGSTKVGSVDASDFSKETSNPDEYTKTIALSNAVVKDNDDEKFYVVVTAASSIDTDDMDDAEWDLELLTARYNDATGAILTADVDNVDVTTFTFEDVSTDDQIDLKSSTSNPVDKTVAVEESQTSDEYLALAFKLDVDDNSADVNVTGMTLDVLLASNADSDSVEEVVDSVVVKVGSDEYEADLDDDQGEDGTSTYVVDFDDGFTIASGDVEEVKVYVTFNDQDNYDEGATVVVSVDDDAIDAETDEDELAVTGSATKTGGELTLRATGADFAFVSASTSTTGDTDAIGTFKIKFTATAFGDDIQIPKLGADSIDFKIKDSDGADYAQDAADQTVTLVTTSGASITDENDDGDDAYLVSDEESFTITVTMDNTNGVGGGTELSGQYYLVVTGINFYPNDTDAITGSDTNDDFQTDPVFVGI